MVCSLGGRSRWDAARVLTLFVHPACQNRACRRDQCFQETGVGACPQGGTLAVQDEDTSPPDPGRPLTAPSAQNFFLRLPSVPVKPSSSFNALDFGLLPMVGRPGLGTEEFSHGTS